MAVDVERYRFSLEQYEQMVDAGVLDHARVELIEGEVVDVPPGRPEHAGPTSSLDYLLQRALGDRVTVRVQMPVRLPPASEPEPDIAVVRPPLQRYMRVHPESKDVFLLVEVARTSIRHDRSIKVPLYARSGIPEVWLVDTTAGTVEVYKDPTADEYQRMEIIGRGGTLSPAAFPDVQIAVDEVLPTQP